MRARHAEGTVKLRVLGPLELDVGGRTVTPRAAKPRTLLALLLLDVNQVSERDWLIDQLWAGRPPQAARATLRTYVYQLRKELSRFDRGVALHGRAGGYALEVAPEAVDAHRFEALAAQGRQSLQDREIEQTAATLREGLGLWRGTAAFTGIDVPAVRDKARLLDELRMEVTEQCLGAELESGAPTAAVAELEALTAANPLRESLWRLLMLGLHRAGRQGEALAAYQRLYRLLDEHLGLRPSKPVEQLHQRILCGGPESQQTADEFLAVGAVPLRPRAAEWTFPRQLPASATYFTGRTPELTELDRMLPGDDAAAGAVPVAVLTGTAGIGKTALAIHWAHRVADRFPDGQLYVNLRGFDPVGPAMAPAEAVRTFLDALGVAPERIPHELDSQVGLFRSLLADKRVLVILDNARYADQVRPLLPNASGSLVVITSRDRLSGLITQGSHPIILDQLGAEDAARFLTRRLRTKRTAAEPEATDQIIDACSGLPLALAIVAARAAANPGFPLAALAAELRGAGGRLNALADSDQTIDVRAVFSWSYRALKPDIARLFRLLSVHPGPDFTCAAAASLAGIEPRHTHRLLADLARANLLVESRPGRFSFHDLLRSYATELADADDSPDDRNGAVHRMLDHYLRTAHAGSRLLDPNQDPIALAPARHGVTPEPVDDDGAAMAWFAAEHDVLIAAVDHAAEHRFDVHCWQLAWSLPEYLHRRGHWREVAATWQTALEAVRRLGDAAVEVRGNRLLAQAYTRLDRVEDAHKHLDRALTLCEGTNDRLGQAHTSIVRGRLWMRQGRFGEAIECSERALELYEATGDRDGQANALGAIGWCHTQAGDHLKALTYCERSLILLQAADDRPGQSATLDSLGYIHHHLGQHDRAVAHYQRALELARDLDIRSSEAITLTNLGDTLQTMGDPAAARRAWQRALAILDDLGHADAEQVRAKLAGLDAKP